MNAQYTQYAYKIRNALNESADRLPDDISHRLANARKIALNHRKTAQLSAVHAPAETLQVNVDGSLSLGGGKNGLGDFFNQWRTLFSVGLPLLVLVVGLVGIVHFEQQNRITDLADIDAAMLTDDLPPQAYVDSGFRAYLKASGVQLNQVAD